MMTRSQTLIRLKQREQHPQICPVCGQDYWDTYCGLTTCCFAVPIDAPQPQATVIELPVLASAWKKAA